MTTHRCTDTPPLTLHLCGTSKCPHDYSGEELIEDGERIIGSTAVCVKCGARAIDEAAWE